MLNKLKCHKVASFKIDYCSPSYTSNIKHSIIFPLLNDSKTAEMQALQLTQACPFHSTLSLYVNNKLSTCFFGVGWGGKDIKMK